MQRKLAGPNLMKTVTAHDIHGTTYKIAVDQLSWRPAVYGVIIRDDKVLLAKEWDGYDFPGGGVKLGETIEEALVREVKEETGFDVIVGKILLTKSSFFKKVVSGTYVQSILMYYAATLIGGIASIENIEGWELEYMGMPEWIDIDKAKELKFFNDIDSPALIKTATS